MKPDWSLIGVVRTLKHDIVFPDDPVAIFDYHKPSPNSVLKMLQDIFSRIETANIFFTNDLMVLIDIVLRQLTDRSHGDKVCTFIASFVANSSVN